mmetsp:Transcript_18266/g.31117  ORF Transcript_18266/g.31117 Transcript_18266/m.31117 type:complete len:314 (-) Transcript_18266:63-1004(-)
MDTLRIGRRHVGQSIASFVGRSNGRTATLPVRGKHLLLRYLSTNPNSSFAVVDHSEAYEESIGGRHGQQLALATIYGLEKEKARQKFDPFSEKDLTNEVSEGLRYDNDLEDDLAFGNADNDGEAGASEAKDGEVDDEGYDEDDEDEYEEGDEAEDELAEYNSDGSVKYKPAQLEAFKAGAPAGGMFAVISLAGSQHKVTVDDVLVVNRLKPVSEYAVGTTKTLTDVLVVGSSHKTLVGLPIVSGAEVDVMVEEITKDAKVIVFKKRRRKHSQRKNGFRRDVTMLRILDIRMPVPHGDHDYLPRFDPTQELIGS